MRPFHVGLGALAIGLATAVSTANVKAQANAEVPTLKLIPAAASPIATRAMLLGAAWAGPRAVAVGDHGIVLLSDDRGKSFRQARHVPLSSTLTSVSFADAQHGWAVGHRGAVLRTDDGGETWSVQRTDLEEDRPLFAVHFFDAEHGLAVGLWSLVLTTDDGGRTWVARQLDPAPGARKADLNLLSLFADGKGSVYATAEKGQLLRSDDRGRTWRYLDTAYKGSLWAGASLADGSLVVGGQRGTLMRSTDSGQHWERVPLESKNSITTVVQDGVKVFVGGLDGLQAYSADGGQHFALAHGTNGESVTSALATPNGTWVLLSRQGVATK